MEYFNDFLSRVINLLSEFLFVFNKTLFKIGDSEVSIGTIVVFFCEFLSFSNCIKKCKTSFTI